MTWQKYQLDNTIFKTTDALTLCRTERSVIEINKNSLAIPIKLDNQIEGYIFHGRGTLLLDTIVETTEGAIGRSIDREINEPFIMLGNIEEIQHHLNTTSTEDLTDIKYESKQDFMAKAENLLNRFLKREIIHKHQCCGHNHAFIFAFPNESKDLDILIANGSKLVYKAIGTVFVSNKDKVIMKTLDDVILSHNGKLFTIRK
jgi:hypothetical protein